MQFEKVKKMQREFEKVTTSFISTDPLHLLESIRLEFTLNVVEKKTGKMGFVQLYDEESVEFIVLTENSSRLIPKESFEADFLELPKDAVKTLIDFSVDSPKFVEKNGEVFLYLKESNCLVSNLMENISLNEEVKWISKSFGKIEKGEA